MVVNFLLKFRIIFKLYKNLVEFNSNEYDIFNAYHLDHNNPNTYIFIDQFFSYIPTINNQYYSITNLINPGIIYTMVYTDKYIDHNPITGNIVNKLYYYRKYCNEIILNRTSTLRIINIAVKFININETFW